MPFLLLSIWVGELTLFSIGKEAITLCGGLLLGINDMNSDMQHVFNNQSSSNYKRKSDSLSS